LFFAIGTKGWRVKGHKSRASGMCPCHFFNDRMDSFQMRLCACNHTKTQWALSVGGKFPLPCPANFRVLLGVAVVYKKHQVSSGENVLPLFLQSRVLWGVFRIPGLEESKNCLCCWRIELLQ